MATNPLHTTKRVQVDKTKALVLSIVIISSVVSVFALVASRSFYSQASYLNRVAAEKEKALKQLKANEFAVTSLVKSYNEFSSNNPNLLGGSTSGNAERDGDNARLVLDALPSKYDFPALATSLEKLLSGYIINNITGSDDAATQAENSELVEIPFKLDVATNYGGMQTLLTTFEKSIRPFEITSIEFTGTNANLQSTITAKTFYQPEKDLKVTTKVIK